MATPAHRIAQATITCDAPRGALRVQAAADRLTRRLRRDLAPSLSRSLARALGADRRYVVIDRLDCGVIDLGAATDEAAVAVLAARIAEEIEGAAQAGAQAGGGAGAVRIYQSEAYYVAAFVAAQHAGVHTTDRHWRALMPNVRSDPLATALSLSSARGLGLEAVLRGVAARASLPAILASAPMAAVTAVRDQLCGDSSAGRAGQESLAFIAETLLRVAGTPRAPRAALLAAIEAEPVDWCDWGSLADALARALTVGRFGEAYHPRGAAEGAIPEAGQGIVGAEARPSTFPAPQRAAQEATIAAPDRDWRKTQAGEPAAKGLKTSAVRATERGEDRVTPAVADALAALDWVDNERLAAHFSGSAVGAEGATPPPLKRMVEAVRDLGAALDAAIGELVETAPARITASALQVLWLLRFDALYPSWRGQALPREISRRVVAQTGALPTPAGWDDLERRWSAAVATLTQGSNAEGAEQAGATMTSPAPSSAVPTTEIVRGGPRQPPLGTPAATARAPTPKPAEALRPLVHATEAAGLFLLWRTLIDLRLSAALQRTGDGEAREAPMSQALWTLASAVSGLEVTQAERDPGVRLFCALAPEDAAPDALPAETEAALARSLQAFHAFRHQSCPATLRATILTAFTFWLRGFERSTPDYVAERFLHRGGTVLTHRDRIHVTIDPRPFDLVVKRAGYLDALKVPHWLGGARVSFMVGSAR